MVLGVNRASSVMLYGKIHIRKIKNIEFENPTFLSNKGMNAFIMADEYAKINIIRPTTPIPRTRSINPL